jgi:hypothetical protein
LYLDLLLQASSFLLFLPSEARGGFSEWLCSHVLKNVPHRLVVFSIPKILRRYFLYNRDLLSDLSRCPWESLKLFLWKTVPEWNPIPGAVIAIQPFMDSPNISNENRSSKTQS